MCDVIILVLRYCGNEGMCGGRKVKELTPVTTPQLNAVRSFPCTGVDATCGGGSAAGPANAANICTSGTCNDAKVCFEAMGYVSPSFVSVVAYRQTDLSQLRVSVVAYRQTDIRNSGLSLYSRQIRVLSICDTNLRYR